MTNERAIELLNRISDEQFDGVHGDERREALEMAVRALEGDGDTISRKMAIEAFEPTHHMDWYTPTIIETLETLPSVRPEVLACGNGELVEASRRLVEASPNDLISRQQAIDIVRNRVKRFTTACVLAVTEIEKLPSAQPEEVVPHKNYKYLSDYWCECGWHLGKKGDVKYCSNCGRKVKWNG